MYKLLINGHVIPLLLLKGGSGYAGIHTASGPFGAISLHHYQAAGFTLTFIECAVTGDSTIMFLHDMIQPKVYVVLSGDASTFIVDGQGLRLREKQYGLLYPPHGNRAISLPAGQSCLYCIVQFPVSFLREAVPAYSSIIPLYIHTLRGKKYLGDPLFINEEMQKDLDTLVLIRAAGDAGLAVNLPAAVLPFLHHAFIHLTHAVRQGVRDDLRYGGKIRRAAAIINNDPARTYTIESLAQEAGLSASSLKRGFRHVFQTTMLGYVTERRLEQAVQLLIVTNRTEEVIANRCGYSGSDALIRPFKRKFGCTPRFIRST